MKNIDAVRMLDPDQLAELITENSLVFFDGGSVTRRDKNQENFEAFLNRQFTGNLVEDFKYIMLEQHYTKGETK